MESANPDQERFWNDAAGPLWVSAAEEMERHTAPFGDVALAVAQPSEGERVLDVGCGCGSTSLTLGRAVGVGGSVLGVDLSAVMLEQARQRANAERLTQVSFRQADAQIDDLGEETNDLVFSRFGIMFFSDPVAAFANLRRALGDAGRLVFVCWQPPSANPWMALPNRAALRLFDLSPPAHDAPGPFSLADRDRIDSVLFSAGFAAIETAPEQRSMELAAGQSLEDWAHDRLLIGLAREAYLASDPAGQRRARQAMVDSVAAYRVGDHLEMVGAAWIVTARR